MEVSNRIVIFSRGNLEQIGTPREVYEQPANEFVARFIGVMNVLGHGSAARAWRGWANCNFPRRPRGWHPAAHRLPALRGADLRRPDAVSVSRGAAAHVFPGHHAAAGTGVAVGPDHAQPHDQGGICATRTGGWPRGVIADPQLSRVVRAKPPALPPEKEVTYQPPPTIGEHI